MKQGRIFELILQKHSLFLLYCMHNDSLTTYEGFISTILNDDSMLQKASNIMFHGPFLTTSKDVASKTSMHV